MTPETAAHQAPPSLGFSRQEHWRGLPFPSLILVLAFVVITGIGPCSLETASEKRSPRTSYHPGWEAEFAGGGISKLPSARRDSQPACVWKPIFARNGLASPEGDLQICSEDRYSRGRVEVPDCPLPALQRHSYERVRTMQSSTSKLGKWKLTSHIFFPLRGSQTAERVPKALWES